MYGSTPLLTSYFEVWNNGNNLLDCRMQCGCKVDQHRIHIVKNYFWKPRPELLSDNIFQIYWSPIFPWHWDVQCMDIQSLIWKKKYSKLFAYISFIIELILILLLCEIGPDNGHELKLGISRQQHLNFQFLFSLRF